jgi:drug/metabolite transporter (DMT)-like permease
MPMKSPRRALSHGPLASASAEAKGMAYGFMGVLVFSLTLPATREAVTFLDPVFVGLGRSVVAAVLAAVILLLMRQRFPSRTQIKSLILVAAGVVVGFPLLSAWAMTRVPASHGAIMLGILPLATALAGTLRTGDRPSPGFWMAGIVGSALVVAFALSSGSGRLQFADLALLGAVFAAALGYAEGARLSRSLDGWRVICWALVLAAPFLVVPVVIAVLAHGLSASPAAWLGFGYVSLMSQFLGFFVWYKGLTLGGVARVSQLQLLQPFLTVLASALLLGEIITTTMLIFALAVVATVAIGRRMAIRRSTVEQQY